MGLIAVAETEVGSHDHESYANGLTPITKDNMITP